MIMSKDNWDKKRHKWPNEIFSAKRRKFLRKKIKSEEGLNCYYCGMTDLITKGHEDPEIPKNRKATIDHIVPLSLGGEYLDQNNWHVACQECNEKKGNKL